MSWSRGDEVEQALRSRQPQRLLSAFDAARRAGGAGFAGGGCGGDSRSSEFLRGLLARCGGGGDGGFAGATAA